MNIESGGTAERNTGRYMKKREAIINVASKLFDENGIKGAMLSEVAKQVGLSTNSITYYFKKKEDLVFECLMHTVKTFDMITEMAESEKTPVERVKRFIQEFIKKLSDCAKGNYPAIMTFRDAAELDSSYTKIIFDGYKNMFRRVRGLLAEGEINSENRMILTLRTHLFLAQIQWSRIWMGSYSLENYERIQFYITDVMLNGLAVHDAPWQNNAIDRKLSEFKIPESPNHGFLVAAIHLINEAGYNGASIDRISARLSVTKGSFYHHIPSKEDLFAECMERTHAVLEGFQETVHQHQGNGLEKLGGISRALLRYHFSEQGPLLRVSAWSEISDYSNFHEKIKPLRKLLQNLTDFLAVGMMDGSVRVTHQSVASMMIVGMINGSLTLDKWVPGSENVNVDSLYIRPLYYGLLSG
ncbi:TetR/AcrR family transcriptional regulator [Pantoea sp. 18069]|uniref:TetR/AcrR family transcriptional regulator n=1 Tax=Pantoea sp. 18069 TaxID=2681415 RepID=UPI00135757D0|nr:TetR/AcrR family transcriptional regulator [Pantoea sp. 18069]